MGFPSELEEYVQESIAYTVGLPVSVKTLTERLLQAEEAQKDLRQQVRSLQQRLEDTQQKLDRTKAEANLNAQAVKKHVSENQKVAEEYRKLSDECTRLERECALYLHDREVFMEAADEAEERANEAEERAMEAENKVEDLSREIEHLKLGMTQSTATKLKTAEELNSLRATVEELKSANHKLQSESALSKKHRDESLANRQLERENRELRALLEAATSRSKEQSNELQASKRDAKEGQAHWEDKVLVNSMVASAVTKGLCKATEQEKEEAVARARSNVEAVIREMGLELRGRWERLDASEKNVQLLIAEVQSLRQEKNHIKSNLEKAEVEVQLLDEENKELRLLLRGRYQGTEGRVISPLQTKVKASCSPKSQVKSPEKICDINSSDASRQPLTPLVHNPAESRVHHR
eukprot:Gb_39565 [translate_table: standard]